MPDNIVILILALEQPVSKFPDCTMAAWSFGTQMGVMLQALMSVGNRDGQCAVAHNREIRQVVTHASDLVD